MRFHNMSKIALRSFCRHSSMRLSMLKLRVVLVALVVVLLFSLCLLWKFISQKERAMNRIFSGFKFEFEATQEKLQAINTRIEETKSQMGKLQRTLESTRMYKSTTKRTKILPHWIERFAAPRWTDFQPWRGVFVFFVSYRHEYLRKCLESMSAASEDIDKSSICVFALDKTPVTTSENVNKTMEVIRNVTFCRVVIWRIEKRWNVENYALRLKQHWWFVLENLFNSTLTGSSFDGLLLGYKNDILFVEEDAVLSPDFMKVTWYLSEVKQRNADVIQFALGGWSGENMINAHPDTFIVRTARELRGIAYGINQSMWLYFKSLEKDYFADKQHDWCESMGLVLGRNNNHTGFKIVVPTLSRIWHIGKRGLGPGGDFNWERDVTKQPNWAYASRLLDLKRAQVNLGLRDLLGFLCKERIEFWFLKATECHFSMARWKGKDRNRIMCVKQPYVTDPCDVFV